MDEQITNRLISLKSSLEKILPEINELGWWDMTNAYKLSRLNAKRHSFYNEIIDLELMSVQSYAFESEETNRDISMAQHTTPKKMASTYSHKYDSGVRHLRDEIEGYINRIDSKLTPKKE